MPDRGWIKELNWMRSGLCTCRETTANHISIKSFLSSFWRKLLINFPLFRVPLHPHLLLIQLLLCIIFSSWYYGFKVIIPIYLHGSDTQHKSLSLVFNMDLTPHSRPSPNALSFINLSILFPRLLCLHISIGMERKWGVEEEGGRGRGERGGMKNTRRSARETFLSFTPCVTVRYSFPLRFLSLPPALCFSSPSLSVCTGWGSPGRIKSTGSRLYLGSIPPNRFPKLWTMQSAAVVTRELSVVVLSRQSPLKMSMFDIWAWFGDWTKGTIFLSNRI